MPSSNNAVAILAGALRDFSRNTGWMSEANCKDMDVDIFFPKLGATFPKFVREVCLECPVIEECAWYANESSSVHGMFGGMSPGEREQWRKDNNVELGMSRADWEDNVDAV
jgi:WhiB family redox-sensing transcriptional regulator